EEVTLLAQERLQQGELVFSRELLALEVRLGGVREVLEHAGHGEDQDREEDRQDAPVPGLANAPQVAGKKVDVNQRRPPPSAPSPAARRTRDRPCAGSGCRSGSRRLGWSATDRRVPPGTPARRRSLPAGRAAS